MSAAADGGVERTARDFTLAAVLAAYPADDLGAQVALLADAGAGARQPWLDALRARLATPDGLDTLRSAYVALFDQGSVRTSLYETEHGRMRGVAKGPELADIAGFYQAFGLELADEEGHREMPDHLAVELEFYAHLLLKQALLGQLEDAEGQTVVRGARLSFLADHLGRLADAVGRTPAIMQDELLGAPLAWCARLVAQECEAVGACPQPLELLGVPVKDADLSCCGALGAAGPATPGPQAEPARGE